MSPDRRQLSAPLDGSALHSETSRQVALRVIHMQAAPSDRHSGSPFHWRTASPLASMGSRMATNLLCRVTTIN